MALTLVTGPAKEPLTLQQAKDHLRLDTDDDDLLVLDLIKAARTWVEGQTKRAIITQTWDYNIDYDWPFKFGTPRITLPLNPVASVTSITYTSSSAPSPRSTLATTQYSVAARTHGSFIVPAYDVDWPTVRHEPDAITVRFVAGEATCPKPLERAIALLVTHMYENREVVDKGERLDIPYTIESMIAPYRPGLPG
jgi:uncharacterized phiE125 gp8 family phage protein